MRIFRGLLSSTLLAVAAFLPSARADTLPLPATGVWNGFLSQLNVLECANASDTLFDFIVTVKSSAGAVLGTHTVNLRPQATAHLVLNNFPLTDSYGTYVLEHASGNPQPDSPLNCQTFVYRLSRGSATKALEYGFALPVRSGSTGITSGIYNSMDPAGASPVQNWLSIFNPGTQPFSASVEIFDSDGAMLPDSFFLDGLQPGERRDFALGHTNGQRLGLYRIVPLSAAAAYGAYITRYSTGADGRFRFAFPVFAAAGDRGPLVVAASTMDPAINWGEIANPADSDCSVDVEIRDGFGNVKSQETVIVSARSQYHVSVNRVLGDRQVGTLRASCREPGCRIHLQSAYYGYRTEALPQIEWAYVSQAGAERAEEGDRMSLLVNTFFDSANWSKFFDTSEISTALNVSVFDSTGQSLARSSKQIFANGNIDIGLHELTGSGVTGQALAYSSGPDTALSSELLRVFPDARGGIGSIFNVRGRIVPAPQKQLGRIRTASGGHFFEFRNRKLAIVGDSISQAWMELGPNFNTTLYLDNLRNHGVKALMIWSYIGIVDQTEDSRIGYNAPRRWPWIELTGAIRPPYWFDLAKFNEGYFSALTELVREANNRDITVLITVHDGWAKERFSGHPFNAANGGPLTSREQYVQLADYSREMPRAFNPAWTSTERHQWLLELFADRLIRATADYPNVMYEMFNEGEWYNQTNLRAFQNHFLDFFRARTDLPLLVNDDHVGGDDFRNNPNADVITLHQPGWSSSTGAERPFEHYAERFFSANPFSKPILFNEPVPEYRGSTTTNSGLMRLMWGTLLGGAGFYVSNDSAWHFNGATIDPVFPLLSHATKFFHESGVRFWEMAPDGSLTNENVCLAKAGSEYVVYVEGSSLSFTMDLRGVGGTYEIRYYSPRTGTFHGTVSTVSGGSVITLSKPSMDDWVAWLRRIS